MTGIWLPGFSFDEGDTDWMADAVCRGEARSLFFPDRGEMTATAKAMCFRCPVSDDCLEYALRNDIKHGIWGGASERERRRIRRRRKQGSAS